jgi:hypothetical protein
MTQGTITWSVDGDGRKFIIIIIIIIVVVVVVVHEVNALR